MKLTAQGQLRHRFWGTYSALIVLRFASPEDAALARPALETPGLRQLGPLLGLEADADAADRFADLLVRFGADRDKIGSLKYSVDFGEVFEITVEVEDPRQLLLTF